MKSQKKKEKPMDLGISPLFLFLDGQRERQYLFIIRRHFFFNLKQVLDFTHTGLNESWH